MVYFYNAKIVERELYYSGVIEYSGRVETIEEFSDIVKNLRRKIIKNAETSYGITIEEKEIAILAFNPL